MIHQDLNNLIYLNKGDSGSILVKLWKGCPAFPIPIDIKDSDLILFGVFEPCSCFENALIRKVFTKEDIDLKNNKLIINLLPKDTEYLIPATYYWTVKIVTQNEDSVITNYQTDNFTEVNTLVSNKKFIILE